MSAKFVTAAAEDGRCTSQRWPETHRCQVSTAHRGSAAHPRVGWLPHRSNQCAYARRHRRSSDPSATFPRPEQAEALTMPPDDGFRLDDDECGSPRGPRARQPRPETPICRRQLQPPRSRPIQHLKLVPQRDQFKLQGGARPKPASERDHQRDQDGNHRHGACPGRTRTSMVATRTAFSVGTG